MRSRGGSSPAGPVQRSRSPWAHDSTSSAMGPCFWNVLERSILARLHGKYTAVPTLPWNPPLLILLMRQCHLSEGEPWAFRYRKSRKTLSLA